MTFALKTKCNTLHLLMNNFFFSACALQLHIQIAVPLYSDFSHYIPTKRPSVLQDCKTKNYEHLMRPEGCKEIKPIAACHRNQ